jgi:methylphosphotriester-DNA--protein-cysteine methyltransferase
MGASPATEPLQPQTRRTLVESLGVSVVDFRCRAHVEPLGPEEPNPTHSIVFVRKGLFRRTRQSETLLADANHVLFFNAGEPCRYSHPLPGGDECTILVVDGQRALELVGRHAPRDAERPAAPFRLGHGLASQRAARLHYELLALVRSRAPKLALEDVVAELADEAVGAAYRLRGSRAEMESASASAQKRHRELVETVKLAVNERLDALSSLGQLAAELGCSPFHLSRTFHRTAGLSLRAYARRLRARRAAEHLAAGARDLTRLALELGYADHSHFTNAFRDEWGTPPSRFRDSHRGPTGEPRKIFQASHPAES